eukprot:scaffold507327_cov43-Prasinocladus_malaysianus.AAC.2
MQCWLCGDGRRPVVLAGSSASWSSPPTRPSVWAPLRAHPPSSSNRSANPVAIHLSDQSFSSFSWHI